MSKPGAAIRVNRFAKDLAHTDLSRLPKVKRIQSGSASEWQVGMTGCLVNLMMGLLATRRHTLSVVHSAHWCFEAVGVGEPIGYTMLRIQPFRGSYPTYLAFLGDPTLRLPVVSPPRALTAVN